MGRRKAYLAELEGACFDVKSQSTLAAIDGDGNGQICGFGRDSIAYHRMGMAENCRILAMQQLSDERRIELGVGAPPPKPKKADKPSLKTSRAIRSSRRLAGCGACLRSGARVSKMPGMDRPASAAPTAALQALKDILGPGGWLDADAADREPFETDFRRLHRGATPLVALPDSTARVAGLGAALR